jgi:hypothetical protein
MEAQTRTPLRLQSLLPLSVVAIVVHHVLLGIARLSRLWALLQLW